MGNMITFTTQKLKNIKRNSFIKNVIIMASGTAAAQVIALLLSPVITRLYGPESYGLMGSYMAIVAIIVPVAALTYPIAIVLPKSETEAKGIIRVSITITMINAGILLIVLLAFYQTILDVFNLNQLGNFLYLIPLTILFAGILQVTEQWLIRMKYFKISARVTFIQAFLTHGGIATIGFFNPLASVLVMFQSSKEGLKAALMLFSLRKKEKNRIVKLTNDKIPKRLILKKYNDFPFFRAPEVFLNAVSQGLPILMLTSFFGPASAGFYTICKTVLNMPAQLVGKSVGDVFYPRVAEAANLNENVTGLIRKATLSLALIGFLPFGVVVLFGPWLFSFVFGSDWLSAGEYARYISLWSFFALLNLPSVKSLPVLSAQSFQLKYTIFMLVMRISMLSLGYYVFASDIIAIALFGISGALLNIGLIIITLRISKKYDQNKIYSNTL
ncbi:lipopolysaccharide biosynthesis protein [Alkalihalobacillus sp. CinArs1]|uniref:lipopolysaccharide biosynthesis protein n=1 Tax=Alkalihalobacillus sp. CinArs1 TaxID=2995314 RepID=UPI0022DDB829|nr:oligosaccharide flippase family protein [Alkalihalobacillus sp. CinArs1]